MLPFETSKSFVRLTQNIQMFFKNFDSKLEREVFSLKFKILLCILESKQISPTKLVETLGLAKSNVAKFCKELEDENKICSVGDENDRRGKYYSLTKGGEKYVYSCLTSLEKALGKVSESDLNEAISAVDFLNKILSSKGEQNA